MERNSSRYDAKRRAATDESFNVCTIRCEPTVEPKLRDNLPPCSFSVFFTWILDRCDKYRTLAAFTWTFHKLVMCNSNIPSLPCRRGRSRDGAVVRALASYQRGPGSIPGPGVICGLSLLLLLYSPPKGFSPGTPVFPSPQKPIRSRNARTYSERVLENS